MRASAFRAPWAIAQAEAARALGTPDWRVVVALSAAAVLAAASWPALQAGVGRGEDGLYPFAASPSSPYLPALQQDPRFQEVKEAPTSLGRGIALYADGELHPAPDGRGQAALVQARRAVAAWQERVLAGEANRSAAYPLQVTLLQVPQASAPAGEGAGERGTAPSPAPSLQRGNSTAPESIADAVGPLGPATQLASPRALDPPFPVRSLLLTFAYLVPMNFVAQLQAGALRAERNRHRGLLLLASPLGGTRILAARALPFAAMALAVVLGATWAIGAGGVGLLGGAVMAAFLLASAILLGLLARSERELTFLLTGASTLFASFLFLPALFTAIPAVAYLSPVSLVAAGIDGRTVGWAGILFGTLPLAAATGALALLAGALYRDETLHSQAGLASRIAAAVRRLTPTAAATFAAGFLAVPFAIAGELLALGLSVPLGLGVALPAILVGAAAIEERLKRAVTGARVAQRPATLGRVVAAALLVGSGFVAGEKLLTLALLAGLQGAGIPGIAILPGLGLAALAAPWLLHCTCAAVAMSHAIRRDRFPPTRHDQAPAARPSRLARMASLAAAIALHVAYNLAVAA